MDPVDDGRAAGLRVLKNPQNKTKQRSARLPATSALRVTVAASGPVGDSCGGYLMRRPANSEDEDE